VTAVGAGEGPLVVVLFVGPLVGASVKVFAIVGAWDSASSSPARMVGAELASGPVGVDETAPAVTVGLSVVTSEGLVVFGSPDTPMTRVEGETEVASEGLSVA
jgi:hypothetical protein